MSAPSPDTTRKLGDDLPSDQAGVALSSALYRVKKLETALGYVIERVAALEGGSPHRQPGHSRGAQQTGE